MNTEYTNKELFEMFVESGHSDISDFAHETADSDRRSFMNYDADKFVESLSANGEIEAFELAKEFGAIDASKGLSSIKCAIAFCALYQAIQNQLQSIDEDEFAQWISEDCFSLLITDASGVYIPQRYIENDYPESNPCDLSEEDIEIIKKGPTQDNEWYWETWETLLNKSNGELHHSGDLWKVDIDKLNDWETLIEKHFPNVDWYSIMDTVFSS